MNKIILISGGNRGIGLGIIKKLADQGHMVIMGSRNLEKGREASKEIPALVHVVQLDVTNEKDIYHTVNYIEKQFGKLDVLINNAGVFSSSSNSLETSMDDVKDVMESNFYGPWKLSQAMLPLLMNSNSGRIINMSSDMGTLENLKGGGYAAYRLSKTALNGLTILMANECTNNIKINAMCPGWVKTDMGGPNAPRTIEEGADTAAWLATEENIPTGRLFKDRKIIDW